MTELTNGQPPQVIAAQRGEVLDIGTVVFGLRWLLFRFEQSDGPTRLFCVEGCYEWRDARYSFKWGLGLILGKPAVFFNGPKVVRVH